MDELKIIDLLESIQILERKLTMSLVDSGLRMPQYRVLIILKSSGSSTVSDLSKKLRITRAATSLLVNEMLKNGYISTIENEIDRRSFDIVLSAAGSEKLDVAQKNLNAAVVMFSKELGNDNVVNLNQFSRKIIEGER